MIISGHGATLGFGTSTGWTPLYTSIGGFGFSRPSLDTTGLATTGARTKKGGDVFDISPFSSSFFFQPDQLETGLDNSIDDLLYDSGEAAGSETVTVTYPDTASSTAAGSAHVNELSIEDLVTDQLVMASVGVQWDDSPTFSTP